MTCNCPNENAIKIYRGDDTNWDGETLLRFTVTSETVDLSTMTAQLIVGSVVFNNISLATGTFTINFTKAQTSVMPWGINRGVLKILDNEGRVKTVTNDILLFVTSEPVGEQIGEVDVKVPYNSPVDINLQIGIRYVTEAELQAEIEARTLADQELQAQINGKQPTGDYVTQTDLSNGLATKQDIISDLSSIRAGAAAGATAVQPADLVTKQDVITGAASTITSNNLTANRALISNANGKVAVSGTTSTELSYVAGVTSSIQTQINNEVNARVGGYNNLQGQIDALAASSDVTDIVGTYAELQAYDTSKLKDNDIIKVLTDSTHNNASSYYRWSTNTETFTYIGSEGPYYTKSEADAEFLSQANAATTYLTQANAANTYETQANATASLATKASNADGTTIVDNGTNISTVAVKEQRADTPIKQWVGTTAQLPVTKDSNTIYVVTDEDDSAFLSVDSALSSSSENPVQNKVIYTALQGKQDVANLVTSVSSASTDSQYPSAKLFYDTCGDIETLINAL